jgi:hypothetical protein
MTNGNALVKGQLDTGIILLDIIGFSQLDDGQQLKAANLITNSTKTLVPILAAASLRSADFIVAFIPTGDGFYIVLHEELKETALLLGLSVRTAALKENARTNGPMKGVRVAVHRGTLSPFTDINGHANYVGSGLNDCARLHGASIEKSSTKGIPGDESFVVASVSALASCRSRYPNYVKELEYAKYAESDEFTITDKHGGTHRARFVECSRSVAFKIPPPRKTP